MLTYIHMERVAHALRRRLHIHQVKIAEWTSCIIFARATVAQTLVLSYYFSQSSGSIREYPSSIEQPKVPPLYVACVTVWNASIILCD